MKTIRVLIVDDNKCIRKSLRMLLSVNNDIDVVGEAEDGLEATILANDLHPDIVLMDVDMPRMNGFEATRGIRDRGLETRVIILSVYSTGAAEALNAGADEFLLKDCGRVKLVEAIRRICRQP